MKSGLESLTAGGPAQHPRRIDGLDEYRNTGEPSASVKRIVGFRAYPAPALGT